MSQKTKEDPPPYSEATPPGHSSSAASNADSSASDHGEQNPFPSDQIQNDDFIDDPPIPTPGNNRRSRRRSDSSRFNNFVDAPISAYGNGRRSRRRPPTSVYGDLVQGGFVGSSFTDDVMNELSLINRGPHGLQSRYSRDLVSARLPPECDNIYYTREQAGFASENIRWDLHSQQRVFIVDNPQGCHPTRRCFLFLACHVRNDDILRFYLCETRIRDVSELLGFCPSQIYRWTRDFAMLENDSGSIIVDIHRMSERDAAAVVPVIEQVLVEQVQRNVGPSWGAFVRQRRW